MSHLPEAVQFCILHHTMTWPMKSAFLSTLCDLQQFWLCPLNA